MVKRAEDETSDQCIHEKHQGGALRELSLCFSNPTSSRLSSVSLPNASQLLCCFLSFLWPLNFEVPGLRPRWLLSYARDLGNLTETQD